MECKQNNVSRNIVIISDDDYLLQCVSMVSKRCSLSTSSIQFIVFLRLERQILLFHKFISGEELLYRLTVLHISLLQTLKHNLKITFATCMYSYLKVSCSTQYSASEFSIWENIPNKSKSCIQAKYMTFHKSTIFQF